jgi:hypothetical protein
MQRRVVTLKWTDVSQVRACETSAYFNVTTWLYIPEDSQLHIRRRENLESHKVSDFRNP